MIALAESICSGLVVSEVSGTEGLFRVHYRHCREQAHPVHIAENSRRATPAGPAAIIDSQINNVTLCFRRMLASSRAAKRQATFGASQTM